MRLLGRFAEVARVRRLARHTVDAYSVWVRDFVAFSRGPGGAWRHPRELGAADVERYLTTLARDRRVGRRPALLRG